MPVKEIPDIGVNSNVNNTMEKDYWVNTNLSHTKWKLFVDDVYLTSNHTSDSTNLIRIN